MQQYPKYDEGRYVLFIICIQISLVVESIEPSSRNSEIVESIFIQTGAATEVKYILLKSSLMFEKLRFKRLIYEWYSVVETINKLECAEIFLA